MKTKLVFGLNGELWPLFFYYNNCVLKNIPDNLPPRISYNDKHEAHLFIDILAYYLVRPMFIDTGDEQQNQALAIFYESAFLLPDINNFNLDEGSDHKVNFSILNPLVKEIQFHLYHTALRQPEPLARCIFLYRVLENEEPRINDKEKGPQKLFEIVEEALNFNMNNLFFTKIGKMLSVVMVTGKMQAEKVNLTLQLKKKVNESLKKYSHDHRLLWNEIYVFGRSGSTHGKSEPIVKHDFGSDYQRLKKINSILELVCRYILEKNNPRLALLIEKGQYFPRWQ